MGFLGPKYYVFLEISEKLWKLGLYASEQAQNVRIKKILGHLDQKFENLADLHKIWKIYKYFG